jgi:Trypsin-like peptidase domain
VVATILSVVLALQVDGAPAESRYGQVEPSLVTVEVHSGNQGAKSSLGSGYFVSAGGHVVTNYHVVGSYIEAPDRYSIRVRNASGAYPARLRCFDLVNDLALLEVSGLQGPPLVLGDLPPLGAPIVAFGNPEGLGLSLVNGVFNGLAEKGVVDRMLLSMPLNSGMSGGPILDELGRVAGTNVAMMRGSDSLSFGVPVAKVRALLDRQPVELTETALLRETNRQLKGFEEATAARLLAAFARSRDDPKVVIGGARSHRPPDLYQCWDGSQVHANEGVTDTWYTCNLQFTPAIEDLGAVGWMQIALQHSVSKDSSYGFYGILGGRAQAWSKVKAVSASDELRVPPECVAGRFRVSGSVWKANTCVTGYRKHPGFADYEIIAMSVSEARESMLVQVQMSGFRQSSFETLARTVLEGVQPVVRP